MVALHWCPFKNGKQGGILKKDKMRHPHAKKRFRELPDSASALCSTSHLHAISESSAWHSAFSWHGETFGGKPSEASFWERLQSQTTDFENRSTGKCRALSNPKWVESCVGLNGVLGIQELHQQTLPNLTTRAEQRRAVNSPLSKLEDVTSAWGPNQLEELLPPLFSPPVVRCAEVRRAERRFARTALETRGGLPHA